MAEETTQVKMRDTVERAVNKARSPTTSLKFPSNLGEEGTELQSFIEFRILKESNTREQTQKKLLSSLGIGDSAEGEPETPDPTTTKINTRVESDSVISLFIPENLATPTAAQYDSQTMGSIGASLTNLVGGSFADLKDVGAGGNMGPLR